MVAQSPTTLMLPGWEVEPNWWDNRGLKMNLKSATNYHIEVTNKAAAIIVRPNFEQKEWSINYSIYVISMGRTTGEVWVTTAELQAAFWVRDALPEDEFARFQNRQLSSLIQATVARVGKFARLGAYLTIPCPAGPCLAYDRNVSITVDPDIRAAITQMISIHRRAIK
jgi:hypothetical protein